jgi:CHAD domain-containing protein
MAKLAEREMKWDVENEFVLPDLSGVVSGGQVERDTIDTVSAYYDTTQGDLQTHGIVLRRRAGDDDTGWQLAIPGGTELFWPLSDVPPAEVVGLLTGVTGGEQLHNVGTIHTVRQRHRINEPNSETVVAEIAEDEVRASNGDRLLAWKEIGVEVGPTAGRGPRQIQRLLKKAGATPARYPTKLAHLAGSAPAPAPGDPGVRALTAYLHQQIDAVITGDIGLRRGVDPIHDTRVALRRLRSTLRVFAPLFEPQALALEGELKWYAGLLGEVRDCQVQQGRFTAALDQVPDELVLGPVRARLRSDLQAIELPARAAVRSEMDAPRYLALLAQLRSWRVTAPLRADISEKALRRRADKAAGKADQRLAEAIGSGHDGDLLHRARKAAKRARYAAELLGQLPAPGKAERNVERYKNIQSILGDHQDTVVARDMLRRLGAAAGSTDGENGFTFGMLYAREQAVADECFAAVQQLR